MNSSNLHICHNCVSEVILKAQVRNEGKLRKCTYCGREFKSVNLEWLAETIHKVLHRHFYLTANTPPEHQDYLSKGSEYGWERPGEPVLFIIMDLAEINESIATDIISYLSDKHDYRTKDNMYEPALYADDSYYEQKSPGGFRLRLSWKTFRNEVIWRARFFSERAEKILAELFGDIHSVRTLQGEPAVRVLGPQSDDRYIYRARVAQSKESLETILKDPVNQLGAPGRVIARSGRMNPDGISVFYGARDPETCIAEVRPPIGSQVVIGKFELLRNVRLLDFDLLANSYAKGSLFDPEYTQKSEKTAFLRGLVGELVMPVMPEDEKIKYLPTQVIAEYLSEKINPRIDGVIFNSSQTENGKNLVLFNHSSKTEPYNLPPDVKVSVNFGRVSKGDDTITIFEKLPESDRFPKIGFDLDGIEDIFDVTIDSRYHFLKLDVDNIEVKRIKFVQYNFEDRHVSRHRYNGKE